LQHFVRIFEEVSELVARRPEYLLRKLRRNLDTRDRRVFRNIADFIHLDARISCERGFQLFGQGGGLGVSAGKRAHKSRELRLRKSRGKMNARDSRGDQ